MKGKPLYCSLFIFLAYATALVMYAFKKLTPFNVIGYWAAGFFAFTLVEYIFHRWFFHMPTGSARKQKLQYNVHGNHHEAPQQTTQLMMKPAAAVAILVLVSGLFYALFRLDGLPVLSGFLCGYCCYLLIHFAVHAFRPPKNFLRVLWKQHSLHHHHDDRSNFGVSSPLWDLAFGTYVPAKKITKQKLQADAGAGPYRH